MSDDLAGLAAMSFEPWSAEAISVLPTREDFLERAAIAHQAMITGAGLMTVTPEKLTEGLLALKAAGGEEALVTLLDEAMEVAEWLKGGSDMMQGVLCRIMVAAARVSEVAG